MSARATMGTERVHSQHAQLAGQQLHRARA